jgi:hypothetical protein
MHHYGLWLSDLAVEGIVTQMVTTGQLTAAEADNPRWIEAMLARLLEEQGRVVGAVKSKYRCVILIRCA